MPYARPSRQGLPDPPLEDEVSLPRSESYLHLSDLEELGQYSPTSKKEMSSPPLDTQDEALKSGKTAETGKLISITSSPEATTPDSQTSDHRKTSPPPSPPKPLAIGATSLQRNKLPPSPMKKPRPSSPKQSPPPTPKSSSKIPRLSLNLPKEKALELPMKLIDDSQEPGSSTPNQDKQILDPLRVQDEKISEIPKQDAKAAPKSSLVVMPVTLARANEMVAAASNKAKAKDNVAAHSRSASTSQLPRSVKASTDFQKESRRVSIEPVIRPSKVTRSMTVPNPLSHHATNFPTSSVQNAARKITSTSVRSLTTSFSPDLSFTKNRATSQQSAAAHMAVRSGEVLHTICYGPLQFADLLDAYKDAMIGRSVLDYPLLKRLDEIIFQRSEEERRYLPDGAIRSMIVNAETRLLMVVQQFIINAALLPVHQKMLVGEIGPDPLVRFVDDVDALVQYMLNDLQEQQTLFGPSNTTLMDFIRERSEFAKTSEEPSFYFRQENEDVTLRYVQGLCETICGLWPHGKFFVSAERVNPRDSFTPLHFHHPKSTTGATVASSMDKYFNDPGLLGHIVADDYRQLLRGAFPFLASLGREPNWFARPERERDMPVDAAFIEAGVYTFVRTTFIREHLLVDQNRRIRVYVDEFEGTRFLFYFNHRIAQPIGLSRLGLELLQTYNLLFLSNSRSRKIAKRLRIDIGTVEQFDSIYVHRQLFEAPRTEEFYIFKDRLCLLQHRLANFKPERWSDFFRGGYAQPAWTGMAWAMTTVVLLLLATIIAVILSTVLTRS